MFLRLEVGQLFQNLLLCQSSREQHGHGDDPTADVSHCQGPCAGEYGSFKGEARSRQLPPGRS